MELKRIDYFLLKVLYLAAVGIVVMQTLGQSGLTSYLFTLTFPVTLLLWMRTVRKTASSMDLLVLAILALAAVSVLLDACIHDANLSFSYIRKCMMFVMTLLFLQTAYRVRINENLVRFINRLVDLLAVFLIFTYFTQYAQSHYLNGRLSNYLTFRIGNPNLTGLFLACLYMLELYRLFTPEKWYWKLLHVVMAGFLAFFIMDSQSRNSLLVMVLFTLVCAWLVFRGKKKMRISRGFATLVSILPILFVAVYLILINTPLFSRIFAFLVEEGKKLDSRVGIWTLALEKLWDSPLIGAYWAISEGTGTSQMHNSHLDIAVSYGVITLLLVCILLRKYIYQNGRIYTDKQNYIYMLGFACAIMLGIGEAALFSGGLGIYIFVGSFLLLANREEKPNTGMRK